MNEKNLEKFIIGLRSYKPWKTRSKKSGSFSRLVKLLKILFSKLAGGVDYVPSMIEDVLKEKKNSILNSNYKNALFNLGKIYKKTVKKKDKHFYIKSIRAAKFTLREAREIGFNASKYLWHSCLKSNERNLGGRPKLNSDLIESIRNHMESSSNIASNRTIIHKYSDENGIVLKEHIPVRYRFKTLSRAFLSFPFKEEVSFSAFYSYIGDEFKRPHRLTDLCDYCEYSKKLRSDLVNELMDMDMIYDFCSEPNSEELENFLKVNFSSNSGIPKINEINEKIDTLKELEYHKSIANRQRQKYNEDRKNIELLKSSLLIEIDFKQKVNIGIGPRQINKEYYTQIQLSVFGIGIYYYDELNAKVILLNVDIIADVEDISPNAISTIRCLRLLRQQEFFKKIDKKKYFIWADCGTHFRCAELSYYLFDELAEEDNQVNLNFFAEKHGKSSRDQHFSSLSKFIENELNVRKITNVDSMIKCIIEQQNLSNINRLRLKMEPIHFKVLRFYNEKTDKKITRKFREIRDVSCYYNLQNIKIESLFKLMTSIFSDSEKLFELASVYDHDRIQILKVRNDKNVEANIASINYLKNKRKFIEFLQIDRNLNERNESEMIFGDRPAYCMEKCKGCNQVCKYEIDDIKNNIKINQKKIIEELQNHSHPGSRNIKKVQRNTLQAREELIEHYKFKHKKK